MSSCFVSGFISRIWILSCLSFKGFILAVICSSSCFGGFARSVIIVVSLLSFATSSR